MTTGQPPTLTILLCDCLWKFSLWNLGAWHPLAASAEVFSLESRKLSREKTLANFVVLRIFVKVFSVKFRGIVAIGSACEQSVKVFFVKIVFSTNLQKFSSSKVFLLYGINTTTCTDLGGCCYWLVIMSSVLATNCGLGLHTSQNGGGLSLHKAVSVSTRLNSLAEL